MNTTTLPREISLSLQFGPDTPNLYALDIAPDVLQQLPAFVVRADRAVPIELDGDVLVVALEDPGDRKLHERIQYIADRELRIEVAPRAALEYLIAAHYAAEEETEDDPL